MYTFHIPYARIEVLNCPIGTSEYKEMKEFYFSEVETYDENHVNEVEHLDLEVMNIYQEIV